jgi:hypothetical protein
MAMYAFPGIMTPQGIQIGSTYDEVMAAYPDYTHQLFPDTPTDGRGRAKVPGNPNAHYRIVISDMKVIQLSLDANDQDCYE